MFGPSRIRSIIYYHILTYCKFRLSKAPVRIRYRSLHGLYLAPRRGKKLRLGLAPMQGWRVKFTISSLQRSWDSTVTKLQQDKKLCLSSLSRRQKMLWQNRLENRLEPYVFLINHKLNGKLIISFFGDFTSNRSIPL